MFKLISLFTLQFIFILTAIGQVTGGFRAPQEANNWIFGKNAQISFIQGQAIPSITLGSVNLSNGCSAISDANGRLLLFSNGQMVLNDSFNIITNGDSLMGNSFATQSSILVPQPGHPELTWLFTVDLYMPPFYNQGINYSVIETNPERESKVISKNNLVLTENAQKITAVKHQNGTDYWIVTHGFGDNKGDCFYTFLLTETGLNSTPVISQIGHMQSGSINNSAGYISLM